MLANLRALFGVVVDIVLLRRGPELLPASSMLLGLTFAASFAAQYFMGRATRLDPATALVQSLIANVVMLAWFRFALLLAGKRERFLQTATAVFVTNALFVCAMIPFAPEVLIYMETKNPTTPPPLGPAYLVSAIGIYGLVVDIKIVQAAFEWLWPRALLLIIGEFIAASLVAVLIFGGIGTA